LKYGEVQQSIEEFVKTNWETAGTTAVQYENVAFNSEMYNEFAKLSIIFGQAVARTVTEGCYRQPGLVMMSVFVKPSVATKRLNQLADIAADLFKSTRIVSTPPLNAPKVVCKVPSMMKDLNEKMGWVMASVTVPFYYDL
jgi:hypothetical protein